jgi:hypothetical protein
MDCEKYEPLLLDRLYDELDEVTSAAVARHVAGCARCAAVWSEMVATRRAVALPVLNIPPGLEERILRATRSTEPEPTLGAKILSIAGRWAMRPQTAMAAVFLLMIGTSAFLVRRRDAAPSLAGVSVTVNGTPAEQTAASNSEPLDNRLAEGAHGETPAAPRATMAPAASAPAASPTAIAMATDTERQGSSIESASLPRTFAPAPEPGSNNEDGLKKAASGGAPARAEAKGDSSDSVKDTSKEQAMLAAAENIRQRQGCKAALPRFRAIAAQSPGTWVGNESALRAARCQAELGNVDEARQSITGLAASDTHQNAATQALSEIDSAGQTAAPSAAKAGPGGAAKSAVTKARPASSANARE